jgi:small subunit ribosomal protein S20
VTLANHKSALKRAKQNETKRIRNKVVKTRVKNVVKGLRAAAANPDSEQLSVQLQEVQSIIDRASKGKAMHKRTAARKISRLTKLVNTASA